MSRTPRSPGRNPLAFVFVLLGAWWVALALPARAPAQAPDPAAVPDTAEERATPRAAVLGYLRATRAGDYERAAEFLDLRRLSPAAQALGGPELARQLKVVLDRRLWVDVDALSDEPQGDLDDGLDPARERIGTLRTPDGPVDVQLVRLSGPPAQWKVASASVVQVPALYTLYGHGTLERYLPPVFFELRVFEVQLWQWVGLAALAMLAWAVAAALSGVLTRGADRLAARAGLDFAAEQVSRVVAPVRLLALVALFATGMRFLALALPVQQGLAALLRLVGIAGVAWLLLRVADALSERFERRLLERGQVSARAIVTPARKTAKVVLVLLAGVAAIDALGFDVTALVAGLGVGGIAVALAAQKTLENLFGGFTLYADQPVRVGDFCRFGDQVGTVEDIGVRSTRVRTLDRTLVTVPNAEFAGLKLENFAARDRIRLYTTLGLRYETTPEQLRYVLVEIRRLLYAHARVSPEPARIRFVGFGAYSLDLEVFAYIETSDFNEFLGVREDLFLRMMDIVEQSGSGFAFPSQTLYLGRDGGLDEARVREATEAVAKWRERDEVYLPDFPAERIAELRGSVSYPPPGAPRAGS